MITVQLDGNDYFTGSYAKVGSIPGGVKVNSLPKRMDKPNCNKLVKEIGFEPSWFFDEAKAAQLDADLLEERIRQEREKAFALIDKYQLALLYAELTCEQKEELAAYRKLWLEAPQTRIMPESLEWMI